MIRVSLCLTVCLSICTAAVVPLRAAIPQPGKANCCEQMKMNDPQNDCSKRMPRSTTAQECCAACVLGLAVFIGGETTVSIPPASEHFFAPSNFDPRLRYDRPPVPPPRAVSV